MKRKDKKNSKIKKYNIEEVKKISDIKYATLTRRIFAIILDFLGIIFLTITTYLPTIEGYIDYGFHIGDKLTQIKQIQLDSGLFFDDTKEGDPPLSEVNYISTSKVTDENGYFTFEDSTNVFLEVLYHFYYVYLDKIDGYSLIDITDKKSQLNPWFYKNVLNIGGEDEDNFSAYEIKDNNPSSLPLLYDGEGNLVSTNVVMKDKVIFNGVTYERNYDQGFMSSSNQEYIRAAIRIFADTDYFPGSYHQACFYLRETDDYYAIYSELEDIGRWTFYVSLGLAGIIWLLLIPLFFKNGETIGNKLLSIGLVNSHEYQVTRFQAFVKHLFIFIEMYIGLFTYFLFYIVDLGFMVFYKRNRSLSDLIALTVFIDTKNSVYFVNRETEETLMKQLDESEEKRKNSAFYHENNDDENNTN